MLYHPIKIKEIDVSLKIIPKVPGVRIIYDVPVLRAAAELRKALGKLTDNDRERLIIQMGPKTYNCSDVTIHIFETISQVRIEDLSTRPRHAKLFCPEKLSSDKAMEIAMYILDSYSVEVTMPSKSKEQHDLMQAVLHSEELSEKTGIPQDVAKEFIDADKREGLYQKDTDKEMSKSK